MVNKEWICDACNGYNYTLAGKTQHLRSNKHRKNIIKRNIMRKIIDVSHNK